MNATGERKFLAYSAAIKTGWLLLSIFEKRGEIAFREKSDLDFVSEADKEAEKSIIAEIKMRFPKDGILSEESEETKGATNYRWIIDPLDGTHNFLAGLKEWGTFLALEKEGRMIYGICCFPAIGRPPGEILTAEKGKGAFINGKKIEVSKADDLRGQMFCSDGILRKKPKEILGDIEKFCANECRLRVYGSSPYSFTRVALGQALIATNRSGKPWDIAAPALIVEEAGGKVTDEKGNPWSIDSENLIATNGLVHDKALLLFGYNGPYEMLPYYMKVMEK
jgi:myo-inositol-1(or 4)-monophosphatase